MKLAHETILITGGSTGIGFALAEALLSAGNRVLTCARHEDRLGQAQRKLPQLQTRVCASGVAQSAWRSALCSLWAQTPTAWARTVMRRRRRPHVPGLPWNTPAQGVPHSPQQRSAVRFQAVRSYQSRPISVWRSVCCSW